MKLPILSLCLALGAWGIGCSSSNRVTDEDRILVEYNRQMWFMGQALVASLVGNAPEAAAALSELSSGGLKLTGQLQKNWGKPKADPPPYSPEELDKALAKSEKSHVSWWYTAGAAVLGVLGTLATVGKFARFIPGVGPYVELALKMVGGAERFMAKAKASGNGGQEVAASLASELEALQKDNPKVKALADKLLARVKKDIPPVVSTAPPASPTPS